MPVIIPRLGLKPIKQMDGEESSPKRETLLKRSYKSHPRQPLLSNGNSGSRGSNTYSTTDKNTCLNQRRLSVYNFNYNANADDDLYTSHNISSSPRFSPDAHAVQRESSNDDGGNRNENKYGDEGNTVLRKISVDLDESSTNNNQNPNECSSLFLSQKTSYNNQNYSGNNDDHDNLNYNGNNISSQNFLERMKSPRNFSSWGSVGESFNKKPKKSKPKVQGMYGLHSSSFRNFFKKIPKSAPESKCPDSEYEFELGLRPDLGVEVEFEVEESSVNSELTEDESDTNIEGQGHGVGQGDVAEEEDRGKEGVVQKTRKDSSRRTGNDKKIKKSKSKGGERESVEEREERLEEQREEKGDYGIQKTDIDNLNDLTDEMDNRNQLRAMSRHQVVLDKIAATTVAGRRLFLKDARGRGIFSDSVNNQTVLSNQSHSLQDLAEDLGPKAENDSNNVETLIYINDHGGTVPNKEKIAAKSETEVKQSSAKASRTYSRWGLDINKYKKVNFAPLTASESEKLRKGRGEGEGERGGIGLESNNENDNENENERSAPGIVKEGKRINEKYSPKDRSKSELAIVSAKDKLETDSKKMTVIGSSMQRSDSDPGARQKIYKSENFINWVRFDEEFLKPLFGGSQREYTSIPEQSNVL